MERERISAKITYPSKYTEVYGANIHYLEVGAGNPILFLHSIPMSSYTWRNVIPSLAKLGRCIAPDLIGFGRSDKPDIDYTIHDHIKYIEKFIDTLHLKNLTLVMHGYGSLIGFSYAMAHEKNCRALVFYEAFLRNGGDEVSLPFQEQIQTLEQLELESSREAASFVDQILPQHLMMRHLTTEEMSHYREPFTGEGSTRAMTQYIKELTARDGKSELDKIIKDYSKKLLRSKLPKLMLYTLPGFITTFATIMWAKEHLPNLEIIDLGEELHLAQESCPKLMGESISIWLQGLEAAKK